MAINAGYKNDAAATSVGDVSINGNIIVAAANGGIGIDIDATNDVTIAGTPNRRGRTAQDIDIDAGNEFTLSWGIDSMRISSIGQTVDVN